MALTAEEILALNAGAESDLEVSAQIGYRVFSPTLHLPTAYALEETVLADGNTNAYRTNLKAIVQDEDEEGLHFWWLLAHATPLQRSKAYLMLYAR